MVAQMLQHLSGALLKQMSYWVATQSSTKLPVWPTFSIISIYLFYGSPQTPQLKLIAFPCSMDKQRISERICLIWHARSPGAKTGDLL